MICMLCRTTRERHLVAITLRLRRTLLLGSGIISMTNGECVLMLIFGDHAWHWLSVCCDNIEVAY